MMLVISVIVAVAILAVLLNILGVAGNLFSTGDAKGAISSLLGNLQSSGVGTQSQKDAGFTPGNNVEVESVIGGLPIPKNQVVFTCCDDKFCGSEGAVTVSTDDGLMTVHEKSRAAIAVSKYQVSKYVVCVGPTDSVEDVAKNCRDAARSNNCKSSSTSGCECAQIAS
jgi:hypothetical protein